MRLRRRRVRHDPLHDQSLFEMLRRVSGPRPSAPIASGPAPIFIVGLPRSGTTLLERMLGAHTDVTDAGELRDFVFQLRWMCDLEGRSQLDLELARRAQNVDWAELGLRYLDHTQWRAQGRPFYTDKQPNNFLNIGYIARALPHAKILHMSRRPMDA